jgi:hypothetical protein
MERNIVHDDSLSLGENDKLTVILNCLDWEHDHVEARRLSIIHDSLRSSVNRTCTNALSSPDLGLA